MWIVAAAAVVLSYLVLGWVLVRQQAIRMALPPPPTAARQSATADQPLEVRVLKLELELANLGDRWDNTVDLLKRQATRIERANQRAEKLSRERDEGEELDGPADAPVGQGYGSGVGSPIMLPMPTGLGAHQPSPLEALKNRVESQNGRIW